MSNHDLADSGEGQPLPVYEALMRRANERGLVPPGLHDCIVEHDPTCAALEDQDHELCDCAPDLTLILADGTLKVIVVAAC